MSKRSSETNLDTVTKKKPKMSNLATFTATIEATEIVSEVVADKVGVYSNRCIASATTRSKFLPWLCVAILTKLRFG